MPFLFVSYESPSLPCHFPLGPGLLSALLKREGHEVRGVFVHEELDAASLASLESKVRSIRPDLICFSASSPAAPAIGQLAHHLRSTLGIPAICGGPHPTLYPEETLRMPGIDGVCVGEGERVILEIAQRLSKGRDLHGVPGLWRLDDAGQVIRTGLFPLWNNLSELPHTDFDLFGPEFIQDCTRDGWMRMLASRGCPYSCSYCHTALFRKTYAEGIGVREGQLGYVRFREIPDVIEEICELAVRLTSSPETRPRIM